MTAACVLCGSSEHRVVKREEGHSVVRCAQCGLLFVSPKPPLSALRQAYADGRAQSVDPGGQRRITLKKEWIARRDLAEILDRCSPRAILEIGSGAGVFLRQAERLGIEAFGVELNPTLVSFGRRRLGVTMVPGTAVDFDSPRAVYDAVYHRYVLSHMYDPVLAFRRLHDLLRPGGYMFFETGNAPELSDEKIERLPLEVPDHLYFFSEGNVQQLLAQTGFELVAVRRYAMELHEWLRHRAQRPSPPASSSPSDAAVRPSALTQMLSLLSYTSVYSLGAVLPKRGRICTAKYVARRA